MLGQLYRCLREHEVFEEQTALTAPMAAAA
jgi:hypothetical protein